MRLLLLLLCAALAGCAEFGAFKELANSVQSLVSGTDNADPPNELKPLEPAVKMTVLWTATVGDGYDGQVVNLVPAVTEERIFAAERNGEVQARGRLKGELLWSVDTDLELSAGPVVAGDRLLLGTSDGELLALNVADGAQLWKTELSSELLALPRVAKDSVVVRTTDGRLSAVDQKTGRLRWSYERSVPPLLVRGWGRRRSPVTWCWTASAAAS